MTILEQAEEKRREAIELLTAERQRIDDALHQLGYTSGEEGKKNGRKRCSRCGTEGHSVRTCTVEHPPTTE